MGMTNKEKFTEVFGLEPNEHFCPLSEEISCESCPCSKNGCDEEHKDRFFSMEYKEPTTKNDLEIVMDAMEYRTNSLIENIKSEIMHFANAHCSGDDINIYDVFKVIDDCCEAENSTTKNDLGVDKTDMIDKSNFSQEQYKADLQSAYDCGYAQAKNDLGVDCISRQAVLDLIADYDLSMGQVVRGIHALPSVTPQTRKGHWVLRNSFLVPYKCSECNYESERYDNFCPNCGSDNRKVEE